MPEASRVNPDEWGASVETAESEDRILDLGRSYYRLLFGLPSARVLAILLLLTTVPACLGIRYLGHSVVSCVFFLAPFAQGLVGYIAEPLRKPKRVLGLAVVLLLFGLASILLGSAIGLCYPVLCMVSPGLFLVPLIVYALSSTLRSVIAVVAELGVALAFLVAAGSGSIVLDLAALSALTGASVLLLGAAALALAEEGALVRALLRAWLDDDYRLLEALLSDYGRVEKLPLLLATYRLADGRCIGLLVPRLHYGPFRGAGSSTIPYELYRRSGGLLLALHSSVDHEHDLARVSDAARIVRVVLSEYERQCRSNVSHRGCCVKPTLVEFGSLRAYLLPSNTLPLIIIERPRRGIDDFIVERGYPVVDAHNELARDDYKQALATELDTLIDTVFKLYECRSDCRCRIGYASLSIDEENLSEYGVCGRDVVGLLFECDSTRYFFIVFFSNNSEPTVSDCARDVLARLGIKGTIITIDDHYCVGLRPGESERVLRIPCPKLIELIRDLYHRASSSMLRAKSAGLSIISVDALVLGDSYKRLLSLYRKRHAIIIPFASILLSVLTPIILSAAVG